MLPKITYGYQKEISCNNVEIMLCFVCIKEILKNVRRNYQVSKSKELLILSDLHLAIGELKIFDTYLSKIDTESLGKIEKSYEEKLTQANTRQEVEKSFERNET